jgi:hypothetical protein
MMRNKKGIELSINFIVILIFSIAVFGFGLLFFSRLQNAANDQMENMPSEDEFYLDACMSEGKGVCLTTNRKEIKIREVLAIGVGILNNLGATKTFTIHNEFSTATDMEDNEIPASENKVGSIEIKDTEIKNNDNEKVLVSYAPKQGTIPGEYIYNVYVCTPGTPPPETQARDKCFQADSTTMMHGGLHKVYIEVR